MARGKAIGRIAGLLILGAIAGAVAWSMRSPLSISETEARRMVASRELIGLTLEEAGQRLQHRVPGTRDGVVMVEFENVPGWGAGPLTLDIRNGRVAAATWGRPRTEE